MALQFFSADYYICSATQQASNIKHRTVGSPVVRSACEPCHERKIRCIISTDGGSCDSCQSRRLSCFFLPRARSGRRPITNQTPTTTTTSSPSTNHSSSGGRLSQPQTPTSELPNDQFDWNWTLPAKDFDHPQRSIGLLDLDTSLSNIPTINSFALHSSITDKVFSDPAKIDFHTHLADAPTFLAREMSTLAQPSTSTAPSEHESKTGTKLGDKEFSTFLQLCTTLQKYVAFVAEMDSQSATSEISTARPGLEDMLGDIDRSCNVIFGVYGQSVTSRSTAPLIEHLDHASISLVTALIFKIFQVCDVVLSSKELKNQGLMDLLLQKRLDFNLMQARIVMSKIDELTQGGCAVSRSVAMVASYVETKFKAVG
ncbi:MAG: hypothetical protein Q9216_004925 [Gyalolechia sp. 2 TL-2023]